MSFQELMQRIGLSKDALGRLNGQISSKNSEMEKAARELGDLEKERRVLWIQGDVEQVDVTKPLADNEKKRTAVAERIERLNTILGELKERRQVATEGLAKQEFDLALSELSDINQDVDQLDAEYRLAASQFLTAAARSARSNYRKYELSQVIGKYADRHPVDGAVIVRPAWCEHLNQVEWGQANAYENGGGPDVRLSLKVEWASAFGGRRQAGPHDAELLEKASDHLLA